MEYTCYECKKPTKKLYDKDFCKKCFNSCILGKNNYEKTRKRYF